MPNLRTALLNAEPLDLAALCGQGAAELAFLDELAGCPYRGRTLLEHTGEVMAELRRDPPPAGEAAAAWFSAWPAAYVAALCAHRGLPEVRLREIGMPAAGGVPAHAPESARAARELLRRLELPFTVREHAVALVAGRAKPDGLIGSGAPAESYMRLSCALDVRALCALMEAELRVLGQEGDAAGRLEAFRRKAEQAGVFGRPCPPPVEPEQVAEAGLEGESERHRAPNAMRYFVLVAGMNEPDWFAERLLQEAARPRGRLHLLVGPAACGKSTWAEEHLGETTIVSSDRMRRELTGDPADQGQNYLVFQRCMDRVREALREGREVTFDATNTTEALRSMPVQAGRWSAAEIVSYFFDIPLEEAMERNRGRRRMVPEHVICRQYLKLAPPALYEADVHLAVDTEGGTRTYWPPGG